jgi:uncharacterized membrane protein
MPVAHFVHRAAEVVELVGVGIMLLGAAAASVAFAVRWARNRSLEAPYHAFRADLGRAILLGLELLVIADIIGTVAIEPTFRSLGILALIVAIRTFLSFTLELEVSGDWPWRRGHRHPDPDG